MDDNKLSKIEVINEAGETWEYVLSQFDDHLTGITIYISGIKVEDAKRLGL